MTTIDSTIHSMSSSGRARARLHGEVGVVVGVARDARVIELAVDVRDHAHARRLHRLDRLLAPHAYES